MKKKLLERTYWLGLRKLISKFLLTINLIVFLLILGTLLSSATSYSQSKRFDIKMKNAAIQDILRSIEETSEFIFIYDSDLIYNLEKKDLLVRSGTIDEILIKLFKNSPVNYHIDDRQVFLYIKDKTSPVAPLASNDSKLEQPGIREINGRITDKDNQPLIGVSISVKGTTIGTISDVNGYFVLSIPIDATTLIFSYVGMRTEEIDVSDKTTVSLVMAEELIGMEEVVVVGYGMQKKESVVGSISQATGEDIRKNIQGADLGTALSGSVPGLITLRTTGRPGGADLIGESANYSSIFIRGKKTWNEAEPLVLVDGVERDFRQINPYEIERLSILKDASATAVFGVKGANGVILITTSRGQEGKAKLTFDASSTVKTLSRIDEKARAYEALTAYNYALMNELAISPDSWSFIRPQKWLELTGSQAYPYYLPDVDWLKETVKDYTMDYSANMTMSGGTKLVKYFGSLSYLDESDIINISDIGQGHDPSNHFQRINFRSNLDFDITPITRFSVNLSGSYYNQRKSSSSLQAFRGIWGLAPDSWPVKYSDGVYAYNPAVHNSSPVIRDLHYFGYSDGKGTNIITDYILDQKLNMITKGLSFNAKLSYDYRDQNRVTVGKALPITKYIRREIVDAITPDMTDAEIKALEEEYTNWMYDEYSTITHSYDWSMDQPSYGAETSQANAVYRSLFFQFSLNYSRGFGKHSVTGLALMSRQQQARGSIFPSFREDWVGRATYAYDRRYLLEFNAAYNGSEKFDRKYRFGFFPSVAVGWVISNESFFETFKSVFNNFKVRYSDGEVGSDAGINRWLYTGSWTVQPTASGSNAWVFGAPNSYSAYALRYEGVIPNPDIHWETARKRDFGIETGFFSNALTIHFDYFIENRSDIFLSADQRIIPNYFGAPAVSANIGKVDVKGWELESQYRNVLPSGFSYWVSYAWAFSKDKVIEKGSPKLQPAYQKDEGYMMDQRKGYIPNNSIMETWNDVYNNPGQLNNPEKRLPGDFGIVDFNGDGVLDADDIAPIGYAGRPQYSYAPAYGISYKNWSANMRWFGTYNVAGSVSDSYTWWGSQTLEPVISTYMIHESWSPERGNLENAIRPQMRGMTSMSGITMLTPYVEQSRAYLRLESAEIAYSLNRSNMPYLKRMGINNLRLVLSGNNILLISKMRTDMDAYGDVSGSTRRGYPVLRRFNLGISMDF